ncbi:MAG: tetratricopeptide repeat protein [Nitrospirota bacterium]
MNIAKKIQTAFAHHQNRRFQEAEYLYREILNRYPDYFDALHMLGVLFFQTGKPDKAKKFIEKAIAVNKSSAIAYFNLGNVLFQMTRFDDAIRSYRKVIELNPGFAEAYFTLGNAYQEKGLSDEAMCAYQQAIRLQPLHANAHYNLGNIFISKKKIDEGIEHYSRAIAINPNHSDALLNRGFALQTQGNLEKALKDYRRVLEINPASMETYSNLGNLLKQLGQLPEAEACFRRAMEISPPFWIPYSNLLVLMHYDHRRSAETIFSEHLRFAEQFEKPLKPSVGHAKRGPSNRRLRIGYVSPDLRKHSVTYFFEPVLTAHDKNRFEVFCYSLVPVEDEVTGRLSLYADHWQNLSGISDEEAAESIRREGIDILIDLAGHTANNRILLFARKPAPVQASWIGYPATTGLSAMDYKIVDAYTDPPGMTEHLYTEKLIRMPGCFLCYLPERESPTVNALPALSAGHTTFGSFNNFTKMTPEVMRLWAKILHALPGSRLILKSKSLSSEPVREFVSDLFTREGIAPERIVCRGWEESTCSHLALYNEIDIALDTFPYNGTTTTCEALWMGVPVVTLSGFHHTARVGTSLLINAGIRELAAASEEEYVATAVALAKDRLRLCYLRKNLRDMMHQSPLMDAGRFTGALEIHYRTIWENWCDFR